MCALQALFENQIGTLLKGNKQSQLPQLRNLCMELRKVCCHPVRPPPLLSYLASRVVAVVPATALLPAAFAILIADCPLRHRCWPSSHSTAHSELKSAPCVAL